MSALENSLVLGVDTSCDETSVSVLKNGNEVLSNIISSQVALHQVHGGVVPELASRAHAENLMEVTENALRKASIKASQLTGLAVTTSPGLIGCLLTGLSFIKSLSFNLKIPFTTVHHLKGHLFSPYVGQKEVYPFLGVVVSGGHTALYKVTGFDEIEMLGYTVDDAAGEAFDKVAKLLGLGYPGGPVVDKLAKIGNPSAYKFTRARVKKGPLFFSFSGLKTAVSQLASKNEKTDSFIADLCASFQNEVVNAILEKVERVIDEHGPMNILLSGGVAMNSQLRRDLQTFCERNNCQFFAPNGLLCTDNGAMIAYVGARQLAKQRASSMNANAHASQHLW